MACFSKDMLGGANMCGYLALLMHAACARMACVCVRVACKACVCMRVRVATVGVHAWHVLACMWTYLDFTSSARLGEACWSIWEAYDLSLTRSTVAGSASYHYCHEYDDY